MNPDHGSFEWKNCFLPLLWLVYRGMAVERQMIKVWQVSGSKLISHIYVLFSGGYISTLREHSSGSLCNDWPPNILDSHKVEKRSYLPPVTCSSPHETSAIKSKVYCKPRPKVVRLPWPNDTNVHQVINELKRSVIFSKWMENLTETSLFAKIRNNLCANLVVTLEIGTVSVFV